MPVAPLLGLLAQPRAVGEQSALRVGGPHAARIGELWNLMLWLGLAATVLTFALLAWALLRRRRPDELPPEADRPADPRGERTNDESGGRGRAGRGRPASERRGARWVVAGGIVFPTVVLLVVLVATLRVLGAVVAPANALAAPDAAPRADELAIEVVGRQYWWEVRYLDAEPARIFETANELRIPVGRRVLLRLRSGDVIHSFWVPGLQGKMDLVPGRVNVLSLQADRPGVWRGQCAEFCGVQHGKMALTVVAEPPQRFAAWQAAQRAEPAAPADSARLADRAAFLGSGCTLCHTVRGTLARGRLGPDLTHVGSRLTLAAGTLPNSPGNLHGWIADPQAHKPGSLMPPVPMTTAELHAIARYLITLR
ncbi:cytochrome c oxidase subunit II [Roseisolibacter agri]|nr:cytochrome c oxidase subunit II [Roseisolibacter agri]